tara:strand:+ start:1525 stop:2535 length:1011 start_codon:yes stop_codon:yes gene_type:complete
MNKKDQKISDLISEVNDKKPIFTAGPASLVYENISGLKNCFGRGDSDYDKTETTVLKLLLEMSGHSKIARLQGSASLALEIMITNFAYGKVLIINSGYYSDRLHAMCQSAKKQYKNITEIKHIDWTNLHEVDGRFDWIVSCYTETSNGILVPVEKLKSLADKTSAKLMLDATASIGLQSNHDLSDVLAYSSCKGLFGLTGASFIAFNDMPTNEIDSFYLNLASHLEKKMTGPYHSICSLIDVLKDHENFKQAVIENKEKFLNIASDWLVQPKKFQPILCTYTSANVRAMNSNTILYYPRSIESGSVVCHLGEVHLGKNAKGEIYKNIEVYNEKSDG